MNADEFNESIKYAIKIIDLLKQNLAENIETSYLAFVYITCTHALTLKEVEITPENILRLVKEINETINEELKQIISERN